MDRFGFVKSVFKNSFCRYLIFISVALAFISFPTYSFAAPQIVNGADANYGDGGSDPTAGVSFQTDNALATTADAQNFGPVTNDVGSDSKGVLNIANTSTFNSTVGLSGASIKELDAAADTKSVTLSGASFITTTKVTGTGSLNTNANLTGNVQYDADGTVNVANGIAGTNVTGTITNSSTTTRGTLTLGATSGTSTVSGTVGSSTNALSIINTAATGGTSTFSSDVFANTVNVTGTGTLNLNGNLDTGMAGTTLTYGADGTVNVSNGAAAKNITAAITNSSTTTRGTLTLGATSGTSTVSGQVGSATNALSTINTAATGGTSTFSSDVFANTVNVTGTGILNLNGNLDTGMAGTTLTYGANGTVNLSNAAAGTNITGTITNSSTTTRGTLTLGATSGTSTVSGQVGSATNALSTINTAATGGTSTFSSDVFASTVNVTGTGTLNLNGNLDAGMSGTTLTYGANGTVNVSNGAAAKNITAAITNSSTTTRGTLTLGATSGTSTVSGVVGSSANALSIINTAATGGTSTFSSDVFANTVNVTGTGTLNLNGNLDTGMSGTTLNFSGDGTANVADTKNVTAAVTTSVNNQGTLSYAGSTTTGGNIGAVGNALKEVDFNGGTATVANNITSTVTQAKGTSTMTMSGAARTITGNLTLLNSSALNLGTTTLSLNGTGILTTSTSSNVINTTVQSASTYGNIVALGNTSAAAGLSLNIHVTGALSSGASLTIINAPGGTTEAVTITDDSSRYDFSGSLSSGSLVITPSLVELNENAATSGNNLNVAKALNSTLSTATGDFLAVQNILLNINSASGLDRAYSQLHPVVDAGVANASYNVANQSMSVLTTHLNETRGAVSGVSTGDPEVMNEDRSQNSYIWAKAFGNIVRQNARSGIGGYKALTGGTAVGVDGLWEDNFRIGAFVGYGNGRVTATGDQDADTNMDSYEGSVYGSWNEDNWYVDVALSFLWNQYSASRQISFNSVNRQANADYDGQQYVGYLSGGYIFKKDGYEITPLASLQITHLHLPSYTETGADSLDLSVAEQNYNVVQSGLGVRISKPFIADPSLMLVPELHIKWLYDFVGDNVHTTSTFAGGGNAFATYGASPARNSFDLGTGIEFITNTNWSADLNYDLELKQGYQAHNGIITAKYIY